MSLGDDNLYAWPVVENGMNKLFYSVGNIVPVIERGGDRYAGRVVQVVLGKEGGTMLIKAERAGPFPPD